MKLITLNIWGGKLKEALLSFLNTYKSEIDIFCFQEVYSSPINKVIAREMHSDIFSSINHILSEHTGYLATHLNGYDLDGRVNYELLTGVALYVRKTLNVQEIGDIFIYRNKGEVLEKGDFKTIPRNLQYARLKYNNENFLICHFHGIWYPQTKSDTPERIEQSHKVIQFLQRHKGEKKVVCGDFNLMPNTKSIKLLEKNMRNLIKENNIITTRSRYFTREQKISDYILTSKNVVVNEFKVIDSVVSDHLPLYLDFA